MLKRLSQCQTALFRMRRRNSSGSKLFAYAILVVSGGLGGSIVSLIPLLNMLNYECLFIYSISKIAYFAVSGMVVLFFVVVHYWSLLN